MLQGVQDKKKNMWLCVHTTHASPLSLILSFFPFLFCQANNLWDGTYAQKVKKWKQIKKESESVNDHQKFNDLNFVLSLIIVHCFFLSDRTLKNGSFMQLWFILFLCTKCWQNGFAIVCLKGTFTWTVDMAIQVDLLTIIAIRTHTFKVAVFWMRSLVYFKASLIPCQMAKKIFYAAEREREESERV